MKEERKEGRKRERKRERERRERKREKERQKGRKREREKERSFSSVHVFQTGVWTQDVQGSATQAGSVVQLLLLITSDALVAPKFLLLCQMTVLLSSVSYRATSKIHQTCI